MGELKFVSGNRRGAHFGCCPFCERDQDLTFHHLIPRKVHRRTHFKKHYTREALQRGIFICRACHRAIHKRFSEMELAKHFNTPENLLSDPDLLRHFAWVAKQKKF